MAESAQIEAADEEAEIRFFLFVFVIVKECATEACKSRSEAASHRGPDAVSGFLLAI
ncbi:predicted protein [Chaetomium globosum CBS 148.51]|uniref:Uncharacterized protein n=1 Tax=Chaetomium globosum (strain ATCC 6205 / CBS 148.51 / DSM 1962 / NBRC 6347 / NRRL 1970) TaxID=306901 RepID=Q2GUG2_CHAGB|nr:uncharacterized protein CHGG_08392 [Chaetomium globosum CBS 148.51]EAQ84378.1 predicted protein [Chaetomium globosum CBS 148.51]